MPKKNLKKTSKVLPSIEFCQTNHTFHHRSFSEPYDLDTIKSKKSSIVDDWKSIVALQKSASKWIHLTAKRRSLATTNINNYGKGENRQLYETLNSSLNGIASECESSSSEIEEDEKHYFATKHKKKFLKRGLSKSSNRALVIYFSKLARSNNEDDELDLDFIESLLVNGADINMCDKYGQTVFHEVARTWHTDVGKFLLAHNANINQADCYGRTPLHVASAVNYSDMVKFLINNGADRNFRTYGEEQTPVHYAAKNDAVDSLRMLFKLNCDMEVCDCKNRTPLQVAAELDRSETALYLIELGVDVGVMDISGLSAMTLMIEKMPPVAKKALDQYHKSDRPNRKQYFYLNLLEPVKPGQKYAVAKTPMQAAIQSNQKNLLLHPAFRSLLTVKWNRFAHLRHLLHSLVQFLFVVLWSIVGVTTPFDATSEYSHANLKVKWWRMIIESIAVLQTFYFILQELYEWKCSVREHHKWKEWRTEEMEKDLMFCHPRWPEERKYIQQELDRIDDCKVQYFNDLWNILDWVTYIWIVVGVILRVFALCGNSQASGYHKKILATSMIVVWLRLMKIIRAFQALGPFIVMLGNILEDTLKFCFLFLEFFIPYIIAFWIMFGGNENASLITKGGQSADGWQAVNDLIYSVWLVTVVGEYDYGAIAVIDKVMAQILLGTYTALSGILLLNLFIALMSDTFQRVYDNAKANALMQKAIAINFYQQSMSENSRNRFLMFIHGQCAPQQMYYDDDDSEENGKLEKMTIQIKEVVDEIKGDLETKLDTINTLENEKINKQIADVAKKYDRDMRLLHDKINELTSLVRYLIDKDESDHDEIHGNDTVVDEKVNRLPSIYELKPELFSSTLSKLSGSRTDHHS